MLVRTVGFAAPASAAGASKLLSEITSVCNTDCTKTTAQLNSVGPTDSRMRQPVLQSVKCTDRSFAIALELVELPNLSQVRRLVVAVGFFLEVARVGCAVDHTGHGSGVLLHYSQFFMRSDVT